MNTLLKRNGLLPTNSFFDDFLIRDLYDWSGWSNNSGIVPRVNILETNEDFRVEMAAPGMKKDEFQIELDNDMLTISSEKRNNTEAEKENLHYTRKEFSIQAFKRSFHLPNTVELAKIEATYKEGILNLTIPKKEEARKKPARIIKVS